MATGETGRSGGVVGQVLMIYQAGEDELNEESTCRNSRQVYDRSGTFQAKTLSPVEAEYLDCPEMVNALGATATQRATWTKDGAK